MHAPAQQVVLQPAALLREGTAQVLEGRHTNWAWHGCPANTGACQHSSPLHPNKTVIQHHQTQCARPPPLPPPPAATHVRPYMCQLQAGRQGRQAGVRDFETHRQQDQSSSLNSQMRQPQHGQQDMCGNPAWAAGHAWLTEAGR